MDFTRIMEEHKKFWTRWFEETIDNLIDQWHDGDIIGMTLLEALCMTEEDYNLYLTKPSEYFEQEYNKIYGDITNERT